MAEHAGGDAGLLDLRFCHDAGDPAQVDVHRPDRPAADHDAGGGAVVRSVEDLARVLQARIDVSIAGTTYSVARSTWQADAGTPSRLPRMKASSI
jgi:hypothetical protein